MPLKWSGAAVEEAVAGYRRLGKTDPEASVTGVSRAPMSVLFLCTHNSARSQMAEGLANALLAPRLEAQSAGTEATRVHPLAVRALEEMGIDISAHRSKSVEEFRGRRFDLVVTLCDSARESCPFFPATAVEHQAFPDPARPSGIEEQLQAFRRVRDSIKVWLLERFAGAAEDQFPGFITPMNSQ